MLAARRGSGAGASKNKKKGPFKKSKGGLVKYTGTDMMEELRHRQAQRRGETVAVESDSDEEVQAPATNAASAPAPEVEAESTAAAMGPDLKRFAAMLKAGLPEGAVRQKMLLEEIPEKVQEAFFSAGGAQVGSSESGATSPPPPPPLPPPS